MKKLFFTAFTVVAFSGLSMGNTINAKEAGITNEIDNAMIVGSPWDCLEVHQQAWRYFDLMLFAEDGESDLAMVSYLADEAYHNCKDGDGELCKTGNGDAYYTKMDISKYIIKK